MASLDQTIGRNVRRFREEKGWSQQELAQAAQCRQSTISGVEGGGARASRTLLGRIATALDVPEWRIFLDKVTAREMRELPEELRELAHLAKSPDPGLQKLAQKLTEIIGLHLRLARPRRRRYMKGPKAKGVERPVAPS